MTNLDVPYLSQLDNVNAPYGSCNLTSVAMCLKFLCPDRNFGCPPGKQLEDFLFGLCDRKSWDRHDPYDLQQVFHYFGVADSFRPNAKWDDAKRHLEDGCPLIVHGYFTQSGHIIVIRGFDSDGWIVNDPYGEWFSSGYRTDLTGESLTYSYGMMQRVCGTDGDLWLHFVG